MRERVSLMEGDNPILIVAPHGFNDINTGHVAERIAEVTNGYAVINWGWERAKKVDYFNDKANCNWVPHCLADVVKDEFLDPILNFKARIQNNQPVEKLWTYVFTIHGFGGKNTPDLILGYGQGKINKYTMDPKLVQLFTYYLKQQPFTVGHGKQGGNYCGRHKNNINRLFKYWYPDKYTQSIQIEIEGSLRHQKTDAEITGTDIGNAINEFLFGNHKAINPTDYKHSITDIDFI